MTTSITDTQAYRQFCLDTVNNEKKFNNFRRHPLMIKTLEHCSIEFAKQYIENIKTNKDIYNWIDEFKQNDLYGNPKTYNFDIIGQIAPKTIHYISVLCDLIKTFNNLSSKSICEIGVGYGGQCRIINEWFYPKKYTLVDIKPALQLTQRYLDNFIILSPIEYKTMNELEAKKYDLIISNFAFSEMTAKIQYEYLDKIICNAKNGYLIYNHVTPKEFNSYTAKDIVSMIPNSYIIPEIPLTHQDNCIVVWKE